MKAFCAWIIVLPLCHGAAHDAKKASLLQLNSMKEGLSLDGDYRSQLAGLQKFADQMVQEYGAPDSAQPDQEVLDAVKVILDFLNGLHDSLWQAHLGDKDKAGECLTELDNCTEHFLSANIVGQVQEYKQSSTTAGTEHVTCRGTAAQACEEMCSTNGACKIYDDYRMNVRQDDPNPALLPLCAHASENVIGACFGAEPFEGTSCAGPTHGGSGQQTVACNTAVQTGSRKESDVAIVRLTNPNPKTPFAIEWFMKLDDFNHDQVHYAVLVSLGVFRLKALDWASSECNDQAEHRYRLEVTHQGYQVTCDGLPVEGWSGSGDAASSIDPSAIVIGAHTSGSTYYCRAQATVRELVVMRLAPQQPAFTDAYIQADDDRLGVMEECLNKTHIWFDPLYTKYAACNRYTGTCETKVPECDGLQHDFEQARKLYALDINERCEGFNICWEGKWTECNTDCDAIAVRAAARAADNETGERLVCLLHTLFGEPDPSNSTGTGFFPRTANSTTALAACKSSDISVAIWSIDCPEGGAFPSETPVSPAGIDCSTTVSSPCSDDFITSEYLDKGLLTVLPTTTLDGCSEAPAPVQRGASKVVQACHVADLPAPEQPGPACVEPDRASVVYTGCGYTFRNEASRKAQCSSFHYGTSKIINDGIKMCDLERKATLYVGCGYTYSSQADFIAQCNSGTSSSKWIGDEIATFGN